MIIATSFAPSPIARVILLGLRALTIDTIAPFYYGDTLQAKTASTLSHMFKNTSSVSTSDSILVRLSPDMIKAYFVLFEDLMLSSAILSYCFMPSISTESTRCYFISVFNSPAENPIFTAVSTLSPVRTQTFTPTDFKAMIVSGTSSCSLSSIAVDPTTCKPSSSFAFTLSSFSSLSITLAAASSCSAFH